MTWALDAALFVLGLPVCVMTAYLLLLSAAAFFARKKALPDAPPLRIAAAIPAHNEEGQVAAVVQSLLSADYPEAMRTVFVIADNCTDATARVARDAGAEAVERHDLANPGKGQAIDWFLREKAEVLRGHDAIALVDADSVVDPRFLAELSASLSHPGVQVVQAYDGVGNAEANWRTALTFAGFSGVNHVRTAGRNLLGGTATLKGNGMAFRSDLLLDYGWPAHSIVEDMELSVRLMLEGVKVWYNGDAIVTSEMPLGADQARSQRRRWEGGRAQLIRMFGGRLLRAFLRRPRWAYLDTLLELLVPPLSLWAMLQVAFLALAVVSGRPVWLGIAVACMLGTAFYVFSCLYLRNAPPKVWFALAAAPVFILWKIPIYLGLLLSGGQRGWVRTRRNAENEAEQGGDQP